MVQVDAGRDRAAPVGCVSPLENLARARRGQPWHEVQVARACSALAASGAALPLARGEEVGLEHPATTGPGSPPCSAWTSSTARQVRTSQLPTCSRATAPIPGGWSGYYGHPWGWGSAGAHPGPFFPRGRSGIPLPDPRRAMGTDDPAARLGKPTTAGALRRHRQGSQGQQRPAGAHPPGRRRRHPPAYLEAGADIIETCTFNATRCRRRIRLADVAYELNVEGARLVRRLCDESTAANPAKPASAPACSAPPRAPRRSRRTERSGLPQHQLRRAGRRLLRFGQGPARRRRRHPADRDHLRHPQRQGRGVRGREAVSGSQRACR